MVSVSSLMTLLAQTYAVAVCAYAGVLKHRAGLPKISGEFERSVRESVLLFVKILRLELAAMEDEYQALAHAFCLEALFY